MTSKTILTNDNVYAILKHYFKMNNIKIGSREVKEKLYSHPDFPTLLAISDCLTLWNVENKAVRVPKNVLPQMPLPGIAFVERDGGSFVLIKSADEQNVEWLDSLTGWQSGSIDGFCETWDGNLLLLKSENDFEPAERVKTKIIPYVITLISVSVAAALVIIAMSNNAGFVRLIPYPYLVLSFLGIVLIGLCLKKEIENRLISVRNSMDDNFKKNPAKKRLLLSVLLFMVCANFIITLGGFMFNYRQLVVLLSYLNFLVLPIIGLYGLIKVGSRVAYLLVSFVFLSCLCIYGSYDGTFSKLFDPHLVVVTLTAYIISFFAVWIFGHYVVLSFKSLQHKYAFNKTKLRPAAIDSIFSTTSLLPPIFDEMGAIKTGPTNAKNTLTVITHPFCKPYYKMHSEVLKLIEKNADLSCNILLYNKFPNDNKVNRICNQILNFGKIEAVNHWYKNMNSYDKWSKEFFKDTEWDGTYHDYHRNWCELAGIGVLPTFLINGIEIPGIYEVQDFGAIITNIKHRSNS